LVSRLRRSTTAHARKAQTSELGLAALRRRPAQARGMQRVTDVLDACERLLLGRRYDELTMEDLAQEACIPVGSLYHFFPDRTAVVVTVLERVIAEEGAVFEFAPDEAVASFAEYLAVLERRMLDVWRRHGRLLDLFFAFQRHPLVWQRVLEQRRATAEQIGRRLREFDRTLTVREANERGSTISMVMGVLIDNLIYLEPEEQEPVRRETHAMLQAYVARRR